MSDSRSFLSRILGPTNGRKEYSPAENYVLLRDMVFTVRPDSIALHESSAPGGVWGVVMETGYPDAVATLVAVADGTVSLYFSNGGGIIGLGAQEGPRRASRELLEFAPSFVDSFAPTAKYPLPRREQVAFYLFTFSGILTAGAAESELSALDHKFHPLFRKAHALITEIRLIDEKRQAEEAAASGTIPPSGK